MLLRQTGLHRNIPQRTRPGARSCAAFRRRHGLGRNRRRAETGDRESLASLQLYIGRFAHSLAGVINILDPDVVVLGGGMSNIEALYRELPLRLPAYVFSDQGTTPVVKNMHGDSGGVRGAAWLWPEETN